jgi:hypothetical protein
VRADNWVGSTAFTLEGGKVLRCTFTATPPVHLGISWEPKGPEGALTEMMMIPDNICKPGAGVRLSGRVLAYHVPGSRFHPQHHKKEKHVPIPCAGQMSVRWVISILQGETEAR